MNTVQVNNSPTFGWNIKTHLAITELALKDNSQVATNMKRFIARCSELPDLMRAELVDMNSRHFYDALHLDPSFGTKNDAKNNAMSAFIRHDAFAKKAAKKGDKETFYRELGYALHYLQDGGTPPHTEHGNYLHKLFRLPMHILFEKGKKVGATNRLDALTNNYKAEYIPFSNLKSLFHNTALHTLQPENLVKYRNIFKWSNIQQRCFDRSVNASKAYLDHALQYLG